jgi:serine/threonine protein kinase
VYLKFLRFGTFLKNHCFLGAGRTGTVMLGETLKGKFCAVKSMKKNYIFSSGELKHILNEREILYQLNSPFCAKLFAEFEDEKTAYLIMEYIPGGELKSIIREKGKLTVDRAKFYISEVFCALEHIHSLGYIYRHLCPENILIDEEGHVKIVDFGSAVREDYHLNGKFFTLCCSAGYLSPEQLNSKYEGGYGKEIDWWQFGIVLYELMTGETPFIKKKNDSKYEILLRILRHKLSFPTGFDAEARDLVNKLLIPELDKRLIDENEIRGHLFFASLQNWKNARNRQLIPPDIPQIRSEGDSGNFRITEGSAKHWKLGLLENNMHMF